MEVGNDGGQEGASPPGCRVSAKSRRHPRGAPSYLVLEHPHHVVFMALLYYDPPHRGAELGRIRGGLGGIEPTLPMGPLQDMVGGPRVRAHHALASKAGSAWGREGRQIQMKAPEHGGFHKTASKSTMCDFCFLSFLAQFGQWWAQPKTTGRRIFDNTWDAMFFACRRNTSGDTSGGVPSGYTGLVFRAKVWKPPDVVGGVAAQRLGEAGSRRRTPSPCPRAARDANPNHIDFLALNEV